MDAPRPDATPDARPVELGDAWDPMRDAGDPTPRDADLTVGGAPADSPSRFNGTEDSSRAPTIVYPGDGVILPPNLTGFEVHFRPGTGNALFEVSLRGDRGTVRVYTPCTPVGGGCALAFDERAYGEVARAAQPSGQLTLSIRGTATAGGAFGRSASRVVQAGARPEVYLRGDPINCLGCHVLSRDGSRAMVGRFIPGPAISRVFDVPTRGAVSAEFGANFGTFSPDNARLLVSDGSRMTLLNGGTFAATPGLPADNRGSMPDWSRGGRQVVFSRQRNGLALFGQPGHNAPGDLLLMAWTGAAFNAPTPLVTAASNENNYYPSFAPDDRWVVFNRSGGTSYNAIDAHLWAVRADTPGAAPVRLAAADATGDLSNSWPKFAPFLQIFNGEPLLWVTFSSKRDYGLRLQQQTQPAEMRTAQLWMAAFRPNRAGDPSATAFWLPFQDLASSNHIGQWAQEVRRMGCTSDRDCMLQERCALISLTTAQYGCVPR
jgi:TolB protein